MMKFSSEYMNLMLMMLMFIIMFIFTLMKTLHSIFMVIMLMLYSFSTCLIMSKWSQNFIYSIMLFLIIISGLLIIFLYFSSLISNEQNKFNLKMYLSINSLMNLIIIIYFYLMNLNKYPTYNFMENMPLNFLNTNLFQNIMYIYLYPFNNLTLLCMSYLLLTLLMIIKICSIKSSPLRKLK